MLSRRSPVVVVFSLTLLVSSTLLFVVEPMFAKMILPLLGSTPAVWNTAILFFQAALLAGYAYAHVSTAWLGTRRQAAFHGALLFVPLLLLPVAIPAAWRPPVSGNPVPWLLLVLVVSIGLPFFVLSSTAPLLQRWFAGTTHRAAGDPYFLYRASNVGSAIGLLAYPTVIEPTLTLAQQARLWTVGYVALVALGLASAWMLWRSPARSAGAASVGVIAGGGAASPAPPGSTTERPTAIRRVRWVVLALAPASLMLGVTGYMTTDIAPIPLLWVIPLVLYLASFVVAFSPRAPAILPWALRLMPFAVVSAVLTIVLEAERPLWLVLPLHLAAFFVLAVVCHGRLAKDRPSAGHLTEFYLWLALGGVLGGAFNAVAAPVLFDSYAEYPLALVLATVLGLDPAGVRAGRAAWLDLLLPAGVGLAALGTALIARAADLEEGVLQRALVGGVPAVLCVAFIRRPLRLGLGLGAVLLVSSLGLGSDRIVLYANRTFFGPRAVVVDPERGLRLLVHGSTIHGAQSLEAARRNEPLAYYTREGPLGQVFQAFREGGSRREVAVVGLGTGSMACFSSPAERWTFYEIDPDIERIARDPRLFTFLRDCIDGFEVVLGDARISLTSAADGRFGLIAIDAFTSDAIPVHLITEQAVRLYLDKLDDGGLLAFHISNRYLDLRPILANVAARTESVAVARVDGAISDQLSHDGRFASEWVVVAPEPGSLGPLATDDRWTRLGPVPEAPVWSDDFSNILSVFRWT